MRWRTVDEEACGQGALFAADDLVERHVGTGEYRGLEFFHVNARRIISEVPAASRMPFRHTINPFRGCSHACAYCFARPTHEYLGLDIGVGFDTQIVVKVNAVERLRSELRARRWAGHHIAMGTNTDPYQRAEGKYHLTRGIVETLSEARNPFSILTKSSLIVRDLDVLTEAAARTDVSASFSIGTLDPAVWKATEPGTPHPRQRVDAVARLNQAGIPCGVLLAPILPGISDSDEQLAEVVDACVEAGATGVSAMGLHLRGGVRAVFMERLAHTHPHLVDDYERRYAGRAHLPPAYNRELADRVRSMVGGRLRPSPSSYRWSRPAQATVAVEVPPDQLELRL